jgi:GAF domain-containing protein
LLSTLCAGAAEFLSATSCAVIVADDPGRLDDVVASDPQASKFARSQMDDMEGPCIDAFRSRTTVLVADLQERTDRWPICAERAREHHVRSVMAVPMPAGGRLRGVLQVVRAGGGAFAERDVPAAEALGTMVGHLICRERALQGTEEVVRQLRRAWRSRVVIEQAKGMVAARADVSLSTAFEALRTYARNNHLRVHDVCEDVIAGRLETAVLGIDAT